jgi:predicted MPP superfamily phosphohydrolase
MTKEKLEKKLAEEIEVSNLLWKRMDSWNSEWQKENPKERSLCHQDSLKLIEWVIDKSVREERERITKEVKELIKKYEPAYEQEDKACIAGMAMTLAIIDNTNSK